MQIENSKPRNVQQLLAVMICLALWFNASSCSGFPYYHRKDTDRLMRDLESNSAYIRSEAAYLLGQNGRESELVEPRLATALDDANTMVRNNAAISLGIIGVEYEVTKGKLIYVALNDSYMQARWHAVVALTRASLSIGQLEGLASVVGDSFYLVREEGIMLYSKYPLDISVAVMLKVIKSGDKDEKMAALRSLRSFGIKGRSAVAELNSLIVLEQDQEIVNEIEQTVRELQESCNKEGG